MKDYLTIPLRQRKAMRDKDTCRNLANYPLGVGGIFTREGDGIPALIGDYHVTLRPHKYADEIVRIGHKGWFTDHSQDEVCRGKVWRLPHGRFLPGWEDGWGNTEIARDVYDDEGQAAREADRLAERYAETAREFYAKGEAERRIEENQESLSGIREEVRDLCRELRGLSLPPSVCAAVRAQLRAKLRERAKLWSEIHRFTRNFWEAVTP